MRPNIRSETAGLSLPETEMTAVLRDIHPEVTLHHDEDGNDEKNRRSTGSIVERDTEKNHQYENAKIVEGHRGDSEFESNKVTRYWSAFNQYGQE